LGRRGKKGKKKKPGWKEYVEGWKGCEWPIPRKKRRDSRGGTGRERKKKGGGGATSPGIDTAKEKRYWGKVSFGGRK